MFDPHYIGLFQEADFSILDHHAILTEETYIVKA